MSNLFISASVLALSFATTSFANDLDTLLNTGSCVNCTIENADLSGRVLRFEKIENTTINNVNFYGADLKINYIANVTFKNSNLNGSTIYFGDVSKTLFQNLSFNQSNMQIFALKNATIRLASLTGSRVSFGYVASSSIDEFSAPQSMWSFSSIVDTTIARGQMDRSAITMTPTRVQMNEVSLKSGTLRLPEDQNERTLNVTNSNFSYASISYAPTHKVAFSGNNNLSFATINSRTCRSGSTNVCQ